MCIQTNGDTDRKLKISVRIAITAQLLYLLRCCTVRNNVSHFLDVFLFCFYLKCGFCIGCGGLPINCIHPLFHGGHCDKCKVRWKSGEEGEECVVNVVENKGEHSNYFPTPILYSRNSSSSVPTCVMTMGVTCTASSALGLVKSLCVMVTTAPSK